MSDVVMKLEFTADHREQHGRTRVLDEAIAVLRTHWAIALARQPRGTVKLVMTVEPEPVKGPYG